MIIHHSHFFGLPDPLMAGAATVFGAITFWRGFGVWRERSLIKNTPAAKIRSMAMGLVEINGTVEPRSVLSAPFSGQPCLFWEVDISARSKNGWNVIHRNASGHPFFISDGTAAALVFPQGAQCKLMPGVEEVCSGPSFPPCYADYIKEEHLQLVSFLNMGSMRFRERIVQDGQRVFILGTAMPRSHSLAISDGDEMKATGTDGRPSRLAALDDATTAIIRRGDNEPTFVISQESERSLSLDLGLQAAAQLVGGPILSLIGLGWLLATFAARRGGH